jgi:hypothetical protein
MNALVMHAGQHGKRSEGEQEPPQIEMSNDSKTSI